MGSTLSQHERTWFLEDSDLSEGLIAIPVTAQYQFGLWHSSF
ncbi:conserved protein of unknown function [Vibrio tapetis subsp. tapetis]|uniref:Uncharacterized protein n=1 Tax=Vibrio tapetis subsp. tapetis TaxID=1671868 RepID=A0A2N8ZCB4_9VIBR|nr:conserved protein of unknown function [Vibrio tapetis subsp. tapetis]